MASHSILISGEVEIRDNGAFEKSSRGTGHSLFTGESGKGKHIHIDRGLFRGAMKGVGNRFSGCTAYLWSIFVHQNHTHTWNSESSEAITGDGLW
jgi:hypothetical protein